MTTGELRDFFSKCRRSTPTMQQQILAENFTPTIQQQTKTKKITSVDLTSLDTLLLWATKSELLYFHAKNLSGREVYVIYKMPSIPKLTVNKCSDHIQNFNALLATAENNQDIFDIYCIPSREDVSPKTSKNKRILISESLNQFNQEDLLDFTWFFSQDYRSIKAGSTQARISICSSNETYQQLIDILSSIMHPDHELHKIILQAKIPCLRSIDSSKETAILYLNHEELNEELLHKLKQILKPLDQSSKGIPFGMHPFTACSGYGEQSFEDQNNGNSFGSSRAQIVYSAIAKRLTNPTVSLAETLQEECSSNGLDPLHPAFISGNYNKFNI